MHFQYDMQEQNYTIQQLHQAFHDYLIGKLEDIADVDATLETAEHIIPNTLNDYFGTHFVSIYDIQEVSEIEDYRKRIKAEPVLKGIDMSIEPRYTEVLKWYKLFVKALNSDLIPVPVPGELDDYPNIVGEDTTKTYNGKVSHNDNDYEPDTEGTENQFNLTKKERNPELRRKCIEYYKNEVMGGRIYCLCCGFDFGKVYGEIGEDYIEIHHTEPHYSIEGEHFVDPKTKLIPLCSNCHSMIHRVPGRGTCMTLEELKNKILTKTNL